MEKVSAKTFLFLCQLSTNKVSAAMDNEYIQSLSMADSFKICKVCNMASLANLANLANLASIKCSKAGKYCDSPKFA